MNNNYQPNYQNNYQPNYQYGYQPSEPSKGQGITSMVLGILSICFGFIPGIIMACIARSKANAILSVNPYCEAAKFAKVGNITGKIGLIISIITTILTPFIFLAYYAYFLMLFSYML